MNTFKNDKFIFGTKFDFSEREGKSNGLEPF